MKSEIRGFSFEIANNVTILQLFFSFVTLVSLKVPYYVHSNQT